MGVIRILVITMVFVVVNGVGLLCRIMVNRYENFEAQAIASSTVASRRAPELAHPGPMASTMAIAPAAVAALSGVSPSGAENSQIAPAPWQRHRSRSGPLGLALCACGGGGGGPADDAIDAQPTSPPHQVDASP